MTSEASMEFPPAPWALAGSMWLTVFRLAAPAEGHDGLRPLGIYGAAFVSYVEPSPLTYSELLVARLLRRDEGRGRRATVTDIWVDSPASRAGGRTLWAIPKELCDFELETAHGGPLSTTEWTASRQRRPIATVSFTDFSRTAPRTPFRAGTWQPPLPGQDRPRAATITGSARSLPARGRWEFSDDGPLAFLSGARQLGSVRLADFRMSFG